MIQSLKICRQLIKTSAQVVITRSKRAHRYAPYWILILSFASVVASPWIASFISHGSMHWTRHYLSCWFRVLESIAVIATLCLSVQGFLAIYKKPLNLLQYSEQIGNRVFIVSLFFAIASVVLCFVSVILIWSGMMGGHLVGVVIAEALFISFDLVVIAALRPLKEARSDMIVALLESWVRYIDTPVTLAFALLVLGICYLRWQNVFQADQEVEAFATGAVFFALMAANLAFVAANTSAERALVHAVEGEVGGREIIHGDARYPPAGGPVEELQRGARGHGEDMLDHRE